MLQRTTALARRLFGGLLLAAGAAVLAQAPEPDASLNESILRVPKKGAFTFELETTLFKPDGDGPFPVAVINHGKALGDTRFQERYRPIHAVRYFLQRGYAVLVPMRQGFSKSGGSYIGGGCNVESNGRVQAEDVKATLDYAVAQPWADKERLLVLGQSHGGWTTLAFGALGYPGVRGLINFAGGLRQENCTAWQQSLAGAATAYARETRLPSLWFYGDNDSYFNKDTYERMYAQYTAAGGQARLVAFGTFGGDAHAMFSASAGRRIWQPEVTAFLRSVGLPAEPVPAYARFGPVPVLPTPPKTDFAALEDDTKVPYVRDAGRAGYRNYLTKTTPRAFAIAPSGAWGFAFGGDDPLQRALGFCGRNAQGCKLYSVDDAVVWKDE